MSDPIGQRPPYEDVVPNVHTRKGDNLPDVVDSRPPGGFGRSAPEQTSQQFIPDVPVIAQPWNEARIMRLAAYAIATLFIIGFVIAAAQACPWYLAWAPFLVGALPYLVFAWKSQDAHLKDESASRTRRENFAHSKFDPTGFGSDMGANKDRYQ